MFAGHNVPMPAVKTAGTIGYSAISSYSRVEILHLIQLRSRRTVDELVEATGLHPNTVREHAQRLIESGHVITETERRTARGRPHVLYSAATGGSTSNPVQRRKAKEAARRGDLMRRLLTPDETPALAVDALHQVDALVDHLEESGFTPVVDEIELTVDVTPCAHTEAQADHRAVLCSVHLGIMQGVMAEAGGPLSVEGMLPSCDPSQCVVQLIARTPS